MKCVLALTIVALAMSSGCSTDRGAPGSIVAAEGSPTPRPRPLPPVADSSDEIDAVFHAGQEAFLTDDGIKPAQLVAIVGESISFINETNETLTVVFDVLDFESGPIEPGGSASYTPPGAYSIAYHIAESPGMKGQIQVEPYFGPGEDPAAEDRFDADTPGEERG